MSEPASACYVYCVVPAAAPPSLEGLPGVDPAFGVGAVTHRGLAAFASRVGLDQFGAEALERNLEDLGWVERTARAHDAVLARALSAEAVVPLRLCTIFDDERHVSEMLEREREALLDALGRLRGRAEWSVKVLADPQRLDAAVRGRGRAPAQATSDETPGRAYFARRRADRQVDEDSRAVAAAAVAEVHGRLQAEAVATTLLPPQHPALSGRSGAMLLNGAYLVDRARTESFAAAAAELDERHRETGLSIEVRGPWAPYNFVTAEDTSDERRAAAARHPA